MEQKEKKPKAAKASTKNTAVIEVQAEPVEMTAEQYEVAIQEREKQEISKFTIADAAIAKLKEQYSGITVNGAEDKDGYNVLKTALSDVVNKRGLIEKKRVSIKGDYIRIGKAIDAEAQRLTAAILEVEQPLKDLKKKIDDEIAEAKLKKQQEEEAKLKERVEELKAAGIVFDGSFYSIGDISVDVSTIKGLKDSEFIALKAKVELQKKRIDEEAEKLRLEKEEAERQQREERERMEEEKRKLDEEKRKLDEERAAMQREREQMEEERRKNEREAEERKQRELKERAEHRGRTLEQMGFTLSISKGGYIYENEGGEYKVLQSILDTATPEYWTQSLEDYKAELKKIDTKKEEVIKQKRKEQEEAERKRKEREEQERKDREEKERLEKEEEERERLAKLPDVQKVSEYFAQLKAVPVPQVTNEEMVEVLDTYSKMMEEVSKMINDELDGN